MSGANPAPRELDTPGERPGSGTVQFHFLGTLDISVDGEALEKPSTLRSLSLLAYLVLHRDRPQSRDRLATLFWGDRPEAKARHSLSTALWRVRRCLPDPDLILSDARTVQFDPQADIWVDVESFAQEATADDTSVLEAAVDLYQGDFLDGFYDDWVIDERHRLETLYVGALERLIVAHERVGAHDAALAAALRLLDRDPLREDAHRVAMRAYAGLSQRGAALEQYRRCRDILRTELDEDPAAETTHLYRAILDGRIAAEPVPAAPPPAALPAAPLPSPLPPIVPGLFQATPLTPLVGREEELAFLRARWEETEAGQGGLVLIHGEAGVGKSRLVAEFGAPLRREGIRVLLGRCYEFERVLPYQPFAEALRAALPTLSAAELDALPDRVVQELARLVPGAADLRPHLPVHDLPSLEEERERLFDSVGEFVARLAAHGPVLVILEDLHWATESTLQLLHYLVRQLAAHQLLIIGTLRPEAVDRRHPLRALEQQLEREGLVRALHLPRLSAGDVETLVASVSGAWAAARPLAQRIYAETEGNPFFLTELVQSLLESGAVRDEGGVWQADFDSVAAGQMSLPRGLSSAIEARVDRLPDHTREALAIAAVLGREFDFDTLSDVLGKGEDATFDAIEELLRRRLIVEGAGATARDYAFSHHKIQEVVYAGLPRRRRQRTHARVAEAMERAYDAASEGIAAELAHHYLEGRRHDKALASKATDYLQQAGDQARAAYAFPGCSHALRASRGAAGGRGKPRGRRPHADETRSHLSHARQV